MADISCPACGGTKLLRYGRTAAGRQKYRCVTRLADGRDGECGRQFVAGSDHFITPETRGVVLKLLAAGIHPTAIAEAIKEVSLRWIYELRRRGA